MSTNISRSVGFILATLVCIGLAIAMSPFWLAGAIACLAAATAFYISDRAHPMPSREERARQQSLRLINRHR